MSFPMKDGSFVLPSFTKQHKKSNSDNDTSAELRALSANSALKATKKNLVSQKLKRFLAQRPSQDDLYQRNILPNSSNNYPPLPPKLSIFFKIQKAFELAQGSQSEGIFRISGNSGNISKVWNSIAAEAPNFQGVTPHDIAGVMKLYIRQLQVPLVPLDLFQYFVDAQRIEDISQRIIGMRQLLRCIPEDNLLLLRALIIFLERVASHSSVNKMTPHNLAVCFGPNVLRSPKDGAEVLNDIEVQCSVVTTMISYRVEIFGDSKTGHREDRSHTISGTIPTLHPIIPINTNASSDPQKASPTLSSLPPPPPSPLTPPVASSSSFLVLSPVSSHSPTTSPTSSPNAPVVVTRKTLGSVRPVLPPPPPTLPSDLLPPPILSSLSLPPPPPLSPVSTMPPPLPPPPPLVPPKPAHMKKQPAVEERLNEEDEEMYLSLIDDLDEIDKDTLVKKLASHFASNPEGFRRFLKKAVGADGVIALLELLVL